MNIGIKDVLARINIFFILYLILLAVCLSIKFIYTREEIYFFVNTRFSLEADVFFKYYTNIGDGLFTLALVTLLALFFSYRKAFLLITSYAVTSLTAQILKRLFDAPRPKLYFESRANDLRFVDGMEIYSLHSFPSGHAVTAFSTAVVLTYFCRNRAWGAVFFVLAAFAGYSRMYLSEHFFEDVVAGSAVGGIVTVLWLSWIDSRKFLHTEKWGRSLLKRS